MASIPESAPVPEQIIRSTERLLAKGGLANASLNSIAARQVAAEVGSRVHIRRYEGAILMCRLKKSTSPLLNVARHIAILLHALG